MTDPRRVNARAPVAYGRAEHQDPERRGIDYWIRRFYCPNPTCAERRRAKPQVLGSQTIRATYEPESGYSVSGYFIERVEVVHGLIDLGLLADGALSIGVRKRARRRAGSPADLRKAQTTDAAFVGRHKPSRHPEPNRSWNLVPRAVGRVSVITCPSCRRRYLLDGKFSAEELTFA